MGGDKQGRYVKPDLSLLGTEHVKRYRESGGEVGHIWNGVTALLLTTIGRKSGALRIQPMIYGRDGSDFIVIASKGGSPNHPAWYLNLTSNPSAEIQVKNKIMKVSARVAKGLERERLWDLMTSLWPNYDQYQERTDREIPVVVLTPATF
ncbi:nitroreductase family deazaflavin-dependent oxidoreductase [Zhongshania sp. CAU 1632]|uniref:Nitroreductase family deazaflavin-dependent oxidoreductase n=2 Tax=Zhongshania aquimaris TaxID=2857107 RepID=A0ABS6VWM0_9GAMM|nr:nitroreductase family deazaflavin-dependent oxidoreductase [Zhongshania aquimaris]